jgi:hypothetical protein
MKPVGAAGPRAGRFQPGGVPERAWADASPVARRLALAASLIAIALLGAFYSVVSHAVGRADAGRQQARVAMERQVMCSAFSSDSSRDLCLLTVARRLAPTPVAVAPRSDAARAIRASLAAPAWSAARPVASARSL